jgi:hypothetical protein
MNINGALTLEDTTTLLPLTTNTIDLGSTSKLFKTLYTNNFVLGSTNLTSSLTYLGSINDNTTLTTKLFSLLSGTSNQINISSNGSSLTLSLPQNISTTSTPTFSGLIVNSNNVTAAMNFLHGVTDSSSLGSKLFAGTGITISSGIITNNGVTSLSSSHLNVSSATGAITLSLPQSIATTATPTFAGLNLTSLTFNTVNITDTLNFFNNVTDPASLATKIPVGTGISNTSGSLINTGVTYISGTANQILHSAQTGSITLSLPQDISTSSSPTFTGLTLSSLIFNSNNMTDSLNFLSNVTSPSTLASKLTAGSGISISGSTINNLGVTRITGTTNQINHSAQTGNITLSLPQDIATTSSPTFNGLTLTSLTVGSTNATDTLHFLNNVTTPSTLTSKLNVGSGLAISNGVLSLSVAPNGITSLTGTNDQITASEPSNGAVTLSLPQSIATTSSPTFNGLTIGANSVTTALSFLYNVTDAPSLASKLSLGTGLTNTAGTISNSGVTSISVTSNHLITSASNGAVTLSLPQSVHSTSTPTFAGLTVNSRNVTNALSFLYDITDAPSLASKLAAGDGITITSNSISNSGVTSIAVTSNHLITSASNGAVTLSLPQAVHSTSTPTFAGLTVNSRNVTNALSFLYDITDAPSLASKLAAGDGITITSNSISNSGVTSIAVTANHLITSASNGAVTLSLPQAVHTTATPTFAALHIGTLGQCFSQSGNDLHISNPFTNGDITLKLNTSTGGASNFFIKDNAGTDILSVFDTGTCYINNSIVPKTHNSGSVGSTNNTWANGYFTSITGSLTGAASLNVLKTGDTITGTLNTNNLITNDLTISNLNSIGVVHTDHNGVLSTSPIVNSDISNGTITDTKLATISTSGKVSNSATTATSSNTANAIVARDANFACTVGPFTCSELILGSTDVSPALTYLASITTNATLGAKFTAGTGIGISTTTISNLGVLSITGTNHQISANASTGAITLSLPQSIAITSSPAFAGLTISNLNSIGVVHTDLNGVLSTSPIVNGDISNGTITDAKLATISTSGKVSNSATTATSSNTANAIVARDASNNFSAGTITASLTGAASLNLLKSGDSLGGTLFMNDNLLSLRESGDTNHVLRYSSATNGPELRGWGGGILTTNDGGTVTRLSWNTSGVNVTEKLNISSTNQGALNISTPGTNTALKTNMIMTTTGKATMEFGCNDTPSFTPYLYCNNSGAAGVSSDGFVFSVTGGSAANNGDGLGLQTRRLIPQDDNKYDLGSTGIRWRNIYCMGGSISLSDGRKKEQITNSILGLGFINALRPVSYKFKDYDTQSSPNIDGNTHTIHHTFIRTHYGLITQEVETVMTNAGLTSNDFAGFIRDEATDFYGLRYEEFLSPMIKAIQELSTQLNQTSTQLNQALSTITSLSSRLTEAEDKLSRNNIV